MAAEIDYNKYQKLILKYSYNGEIWTPVQPLQYRKGEIIEANSYDCGFVEPYYRWVNIPDEYVCINQSKYAKEKQQITYDSGVTWTDTGVTQTGQLIEPNSYDCDYGVTWVEVPYEYICEEGQEPIYRYVDTGMFMCDGGDKYHLMKQQISIDGGSTWSDTGETKKGEIAQKYSPECGYIAPIYRWQTVTGEYFCLGGDKYTKERQQVSDDEGETWSWVIPYNERAGEIIQTSSSDCYEDSNYCHAGCPSVDILTELYQLQDTAYIVPDITSGYNNVWTIDNEYIGVKLREDGYLISWNPDTGQLYWHDFLANNNEWLTLIDQRNYDLNNWTSSTIYYTTNKSLVNDWIYQRYVITSTLDHYLYVIYKINIKTGRLVVLIDTETTTPIFDTRNVQLPDVTLTPFYRLANCLITDTIQYVFPGDVGNDEYTLITADIYSGNVNVVELGIGSQKISNGYYNGFSHNENFPFTYWIFENIYQTTSATSGETSGKIYKLDIRNGAVEEFGDWTCDLSAINTNCGTQYNKRSCLNTLYTSPTSHHRLLTDEPFMCMVYDGNNNNVAHKYTMVRKDNNTTIVTRTTSNVECNLFQPCYIAEVASNNKLQMRKWFS